MIAKKKIIINMSILFMLINKKMMGIVPITDDKNSLEKLVILFNKIPVLKITK